MISTITNCPVCGEYLLSGKGMAPDTLDFQLLQTHYYIHKLEKSAGLMGIYTPPKKGKDNE